MKNSSTGSKRVGEFLTTAAAAREIHADPAALPRLAVAPYQDPAHPTVEEQLERKRAMFALHAHLSDIMFGDYEALGDTFGRYGRRLHTRRGTADATRERLQSQGFRDELAYHNDEGDFYQYSTYLAMDLAQELDPHAGSLAAPEQKAIIDYAAELMDSLPSLGHRRKPGEDNNVVFVARNIRQGMGTSYSYAADILRALPQAMAAANPLITRTEVAEAARASSGLLRAPAGLNMNQFSEFHNAIRSPPPKSKDPDLATAEYYSNLASPKDGQAATETGRSQPPWPVAPEYLVKSRRGMSFRRQPRDAPSIDGDGQYMTVGEWIRDEFGLPSADGCPARIEVRPGQLSPLVKSYMQSIDIAEVYWELTIPQRPPIDLRALGTPIDPATRFLEVEVANLGDYEVRFLPSATGHTSLEVSENADLADLQITSDGERLVIAGTNPQPPGAARKVLTIRTPQRADITARGVAGLNVEYVKRLNAEVPRDGWIRANLGGESGHRVSLGDRSDALLVGFDLHDVTVAGSIANTHNATLVAVSPAKQQDHPTVTGYSLWHGYEHDQPPPPRAAQHIAANMEFVIRHTARTGIPDALYDALKPVAGRGVADDRSAYNVSRSSRPPNVKPDPRRGGKARPSRVRKTSSR